MDSPPPVPRPARGRRALDFAAGALVGGLAVLLATSLLGGGSRIVGAVAKPSPTAVAVAAVFPGRGDVGVPAGWAPTRTHSGDYVVSTPGEIVEDLRLTDGNLIVAAPDVTIRRVEILGGAIANMSDGSCQDGLLVEDTTIARGSGDTSAADWPAIAAGGYTARRVLIDGLAEGFRVGGAGTCDPVVIEESYAAVRYPDRCSDWHGDGVQGYHGTALTIRNTTLELIEADGCTGTAAFFYPHSQGNTSVDIDGLLVRGGGYPFRLGTPGTVRGLRIVEGDWGFGPIDVKCSAIADWEAQVVSLEPNGQLGAVRELPCDTEAGG